ncbi:alpha/beta fold hydrolase [Amorphus sp. 3PC139-8]|uniref:alpha/beta fold hydrolase n=1 Tax=Amorphus sp. 3PC139-8 TaxID=2735676 RepID=UPI00345DBE27
MAADTAEERWTPLTWSGADAIPLFGRDYRPAKAAGTPVVCLPGVTRNSRDFEALARYLSQIAPKTRRVVAVDFRGRGRSGYAPWETYTPATELDDVLRGLDAAGIDKAALVGTSRGGMVAMAMAARAPERISAVVLNDIGPRISREGLQRISGYVGSESPVTWDDAIAELKRTQGAAFPDLDDGEWMRLARQIFREEDGRPIYDYDPALKEAFEAFSPDAPLPDLWPAFYALTKIPTLVIRGAISDILSTATLEAMRQAHPRLATVLISDQGHAPLLWDRPTKERIGEFLDATDEGRWPPRLAD